MFLLYSVLFSLGVVLTAPYYLWRLRGKVLSGAGWRERLGFLPSTVASAGGQTIWIHAVSVGETLAVARLVEALLATDAKPRIVLSHTTPAGREAGERRLPTQPGPNGVAGRFFLPLDWRSCTKRAIRRVRPSVLLIAETEIWPNLLRAAHESGARVALINARLSDHSFRRYRLVRSFMRRIFNHVDKICAQTARDAERFQALGAPADKISTTGNVKFDSTPPQLSRFARGLKDSLTAAKLCPVVIAASTMPGEEPAFLRTWTEVRKEHPRAFLILAPRHPARFDQVAGSAAAGGWRVLRRTHLSNDGQDLSARLHRADILLLDTIGELAGIFELADVVFMGGSLVPTGGHNLLEPAYWAKPLLFGPHMENFREIADRFVAEGAAVRVRDERQLAQELSRLLADPALAKRMGERGREILKSEAGATERTLREVAALLLPREKFGRGAVALGVGAAGPLQGGRAQ